MAERRVTEKIAQELSDWAIKSLKACECAIENVLVDDKNKFILSITYVIPATSINS